MIPRVDVARPGSVAVGAVLAGVVAGLLAAGLLRVTAEPVIDQAVRLERAKAAAAAPPGVPDAAEPAPIVSRGVQKGAGLFAGYALAGAADGLLFTVAFLALGRRRGGVETQRRAGLAGAILGAAFTVVPWLKYPPNPPGVGDPSTLHRRQLLYVALIVVALVVLASSARLSAVLRERGWSDALRTAAVVATIAVALGLAYAVLPPAPDPVTVPATLAWRFRVSSLGGNVLLWTALTLGFALAADVSAGRGAAVSLPAGGP